MCLPYCSIHRSRLSDHITWACAAREPARALRIMEYQRQRSNINVHPRIMMSIHQHQQNGFKKKVDLFKDLFSIPLYLVDDYCVVGHGDVDGDGGMPLSMPIFMQTGIIELQEGDNGGNIFDMSVRSMLD